MGAFCKKKVERIDFERVGRIAKYFHQKPSSYFPLLNSAEALMFDEVALIAVESANKAFSEKKKKEKEASIDAKTMQEFFQTEEKDVWE